MRKTLRGKSYQGRRRDHAVPPAPPSETATAITIAGASRAPAYRQIPR